MGRLDDVSIEDFVSHEILTKTQAKRMFPHWQNDAARINGNGVNGNDHKQRENIEKIIQESIKALYPKTETLQLTYNGKISRLKRCVSKKVGGGFDEAVTFLKDDWEKSFRLQYSKNINGHKKIKEHVTTLPANDNVILLYHGSQVQVKEEIKIKEDISYLDKTFSRLMSTYDSVRSFALNNKRGLGIAAAGAVIGGVLVGSGGWFVGNYNLSKLYKIQKLNIEKDKKILDQNKLMQEQVNYNAQLESENKEYSNLFGVACNHAKLHYKEEKFAGTLLNLKNDGVYKTNALWKKKAWKRNYDFALSKGDSAARIASRKIHEACVIRNISVNR